MALTWTDLSTFVAGQPITQSLLTNLRENSRANTSKPVYIALYKHFTGLGTTYAGTPDYTAYAFVPHDAKVLRVRAAIWTGTGTATLKIRVKRAAGTGYVEAEAATTATAKGAPGGASDATWVLSGLDNAGGEDLRGQEVVVQVFGKHTSGGQGADIDARGWYPSRFAVE